MRMVICLRHSCLAISLATPCLASAVLNGVVYLNRIGGEPLPGVEIFSTGAGPDTSDTSGGFRLEYPERNPGDPVLLRVRKQGYEVVNRVQLGFGLRTDPGSPANQLKLILCKAGVREVYAREFYRLKAAEAVEAEYLRQIRKLEAQRQADRAARERLRRDKEKAMAQVERLAEHLSASPPPPEDELNKQARRALVEGNVEKALHILDTEKLERRVLLARQVAKEATGRLYREVDNYLLKAELLALKFDFASAEALFQQAVELGRDYFKSHFEYAGFLHKQKQFSRCLPLYRQALLLARTNADVATTQNSLGNYYLTNNMMDKAQASFRAALRIRRQLAEEDPDTYLSQVASTQDNLGTYYRVNCQMDEAQAAYEEALHIYRRLAGKSRDAYLPDVATTQNSLGIYYHVNNQMDKAQAALQEALGIRKQLAEENPDAYLPQVAQTQGNLGNYYRANNAMDKAQAALQEALRIRKQLVEKNAEAYLPSLAATHNNLGVFYTAKNAMNAAQAAYEEAVGIYRQLAKRTPDAYLPYVAAIQNNLGLSYTDDSAMDKARAAYEEALNIYRQLAEKNPDAYLPGVAATQNNLGIYYCVNNAKVEAQAAYEEALKIRKRLAEETPGTYLPDVAETQGNLGVLYCDSNAMDKAQAAFREALRIRRLLAEENPDARLPDVATTLNNMGNYWCANNAMDKAQAAYEEALEIRKRLAERDRDAYLPDVAMTQTNLGSCHLASNAMDRAQATYEEVLDIWRQLVDRSPRHHTVNMAKALIGYARLLRRRARAGDEQEARRRLKQAVELLRRFPDIPAAARLLREAQAAVREPMRKRLALTGLLTCACILVWWRVHRLRKRERPDPSG